MRLTLRTLLAWLDDTLPPAEVRQIGQQVAETPLAGELVDRIHRVTRQRRLTVPPGTGADGVDPNIVSGYLDNELPPEVVAEYEKRCLTSDVTLAEVASVHQILSLLGQKAKVPTEARQRMYHLVKGREAVSPPPPRPSAPKPEVVPIAAWAPPEEKPRSMLERYGPLGAVAALIAVLCWSAYMSLDPRTPAKPAAPEVAKGKGAPPQAKDKADVPPPANSGADLDKPAKPPEPADSKAAEKEKGDAKGADGDAKAQPDPAPPAADGDATPVPPGAVGVVGKDSVVLRYVPDRRAWERLASGAPLRDGDRLVSLPDTIAPIQLGTVRLTMVGDSELKVLPAAAAARFELLRGRVKVGGGGNKETIAVPFDSGAVALTLPPGATAGLERVNRRIPGDQMPSAPGLRITAAGGTVTAEAGAMTEVLSAQSVLFHAPNVFGEKVAAEPPPEWLESAGLSPAAADHGKALLKYLKPDRAPLLALVEAVDDEDANVRADAITTLAAVGPLDVVVSSMSKKDDPALRRAAIAALRDVARRDADSAKALRAKLLDVQGTQDRTELVEQMLVGYSNREAADPATAGRLVDLLKHEDVGIRELAIENLQAISRRADRLGYDPDKPTEGAGLKAWQDLLARGEIRAPATPKSR